VTKAWAAPLKELLLEMKGVAEREGAPVPARRVEELTARYDRLVAEGQGAPPPPDVPQLARRQARSLLRRLVGRKAEVLRFLSDPSVPFDNNLAERDLRMVKLQQKVSGCFRTNEGASRFCRIRSYISTTRKQGRAVLQAFEGACRGEPLSVRKR
jgi:transposase